MQSRSRFIPAFVALLLLVGLTSHEVRAKDVASFDMPAQPLVESLRALASQTNLNVFFEPKLVAGRQAPALRAQVGIEDALRQLLAGSGLTYRHVDEKTFTIVEAATVSGSQVLPEPSTEVASLRMTQSSPAATTGEDQGEDQGVGKANQSSIEKTDEELEEIVVTGTHIRGVKDSASPVKFYSRKEIESSGAATLEQFARKMTENFSNFDGVSNINSNAHLASAGFVTNTFASAGFNLYGLGAEATLTLLNGHRLAPGGLDGGFVDISMVPLAAIDHIEVLTDGASAVYGSDAVSGVINIISRKDFSGAQSSLQYGGATNGGASEFSGSQAFGKNWDGGNVLVSYNYNWNEGLDASRRDYIADLGGPYLLIPKDRRHNVFAYLRQDLGSNTSVSGELYYGKRNFFLPSTTESDIQFVSSRENGEAKQFGGTIAIDHYFINDRHVNLTASDTTLEQENVNSSAYTPGSSFVLEQRVDTRISSAEILADGPLLSLPGGAAKGAIGASYRSEKFGQFAVFNSSSGPVPTLQRHVVSAFAELSIPIIAESNGVSWIDRLELSAAARYDDYSDVGSTVNPKLGLLWSPGAGFTLRSTFGTSFRAPLLTQVGSAGAFVAQNFPNPNSPSGITDLLFLGNGNANLMPEKAKTLTVGFAVQPKTLPALKFSVDYFDIDYQDRIQTPKFGIDLFDDPSLAPFLDSNPSLAQVQAYFSSPYFSGDFAFGPDGQPLGAEGVEAIFDGRYANMAVTRESGLNFDARYDLATNAGNFSFNATVIRLLHNDIQATPAVALRSYLNTFGAPPKLKGRGVVEWSKTSFAASLAVSYVGSYRNTIFLPPQPTVDAWLTGDLYLGYKIGESAPVFIRNIDLALSINNITDNRPPEIRIPSLNLLPGQEFIPFDPTNSNPIGRFISVSFSRHW